MKLGHIILFSSNAHLTATFLSDILDLEINSSSESIEIFNDEVRFLVVERPKLAQQGNSIVLDFFVESFDELVEIQKNVEFITYRLESSGEKVNILDEERAPEIIEQSTSKFFFITDPDNRRWKVTLLTP